jgi:hypothetical protein
MTTQSTEQNRVNSTIVSAVLYVYIIMLGLDREIQNKISIVYFYCAQYWRHMKVSENS